MNQKEKQKYREAAYKKTDTTTNTADSIETRNKIVGGVAASKNKNLHIIIPRCGSKTILEQDLLALKNVNHVTALDHLEITKIAEARIWAEKGKIPAGLKYEEINPTKTTLPKETYDIAIVSDYATTENHEENMAMLQNISETLKTGGHLIGIFPTVHCPYEIGSMATHTMWDELVNLKTNTFYEETTGIRKTFYPPLTLRKNLLNVGLTIKSMEIVFFDSEHSLQKNQALYGLPADLCIYKLFVVAEKVFEQAEEPQHKMRTQKNPEHTPHQTANH